MIKIPKEHFIGINLTSSQIEHATPLGFMTPEGTDKAAINRKATVETWSQRHYQVYTEISESELESLGYSSFEQLESSRPDLKFSHESSSYRTYLKNIPEAERYSFIKNSENVPRSGFRITKSIARTGSWNGGNKWVRIEDPRGFELEISVENLVKVMATSTFIDGVCQDQCVWGRQGSANILLPISSEPYKIAQTNTEMLDQPNIRLRDVKPGYKISFLSPGNDKSQTGIYHGIYREYQKPNQYYFEREFSINVLKCYIIEDEEGIFYPVKSLKVKEILAKDDWTIPDLSEKNYKPNHYLSWHGIYTISKKIFNVDDIMSTLYTSDLIDRSDMYDKHCLSTQTTGDFTDGYLFSRFRNHYHDNSYRVSSRLIHLNKKYIVERVDYSSATRLFAQINEWYPLKIMIDNKEYFV